jgi:2-polyprenyl-6-methoxyphenol hydroxylase-like FAD-dependent oxidoreductase
VTLHLGKAIERVEDGRFLIDDSGARRGPYDLVVVADGARSRIRSASGVARRAREYPWGALWFIGEDPERVFDNVLFQVVERTEVMLGLLPSGYGPEGSIPRVSLFWSIRADRVEAWREGGLAAWKEIILRYEPRAEALLAQVDTVDEIVFARYWDVVLDRWHHGRVVYLGDAAHAMSPQLGQGANLALVDAMVLADALSASPSDVDRALATYSRERRAQLGYYQWATRFLTPFFQSDSTLLGALRDAFMGWSCKMPIAKTKMIRTMCGLERGLVLGNPLPLPALPKALPAPAAAAE